MPTPATKEQTMASPISTITSEHLHVAMLIARMPMSRGKHCPELMNS
jgi:hypothetical protein